MSVILLARFSFLIQINGWCGRDSKTALGESGRRDGQVRRQRAFRIFAEAKASGNVVGQKAGSPSF